MFKPDHKHCLVNFSQSILKKMGISPFHSTLKEIDDLTCNQKIAVFLFDGLGKEVIEKHLPENSFIRTHILTNITSTFPPTTVAATTSVLTGCYPNETNFLGWSMYIPELKRNIDVFSSKDSQTREKITKNGMYLRKCFPYKTIDELINDKYKQKIAHLVFPHKVEKNGVLTLNGLFRKTSKLLKKNEKGFVYSYWYSPDHLMHSYGVMDKKVHSFIMKLDKRLKRFSLKNKDVSFFAIADHGMIDAKYLVLSEHPDLVDTFLYYPYLEKRASSFLIKEGKKDIFKELFIKYYGKEHFTLLSKSEIIESAIFGEGPYKEETKNFLPDFIAISNDEYCLLEDESSHRLVGHHGGGTKTESEISIIYSGSYHEK